MTPSRRPVATMLHRGHPRAPRPAEGGGDRSGAEIGRIAFLEYVHPCQPLSGAGHLAYAKGFGGSKLAFDANRAWLNGLGRLHGVSAIELYECEQEHGNAHDAAASGATLAAGTQAHGVAALRESHRGRVLTIPPR